MACTLEELQNTEYEILCKFADFCDSYGIEYVLSGGTLLGAIRHNGFIPWDDDMDVHMDVRQFKKFVRLIKKHPIDGLHLSWLDSEPQFAYLFAKLRKCGTYVPAPGKEHLDMHNGVSIDIFAYSSYPKTKLLQKIQTAFFALYSILCFSYRVDDSELDTYSKKYSSVFKLLSKLSYKKINLLRRILFYLYSSIGSKNSEYVFFNDWPNTPWNNTIKYVRKNYTPTCKHIFKDREFSIAVNYDEALRLQYGDYMTPVEFPAHAPLDKIIL